MRAKTIQLLQIAWVTATAVVLIAFALWQYREFEIRTDIRDRVNHQEAAIRKLEGFVKPTPTLDELKARKYGNN